MGTCPADPQVFLHAGSVQPQPGFGLGKRIAALVGGKVKERVHPSGALLSRNTTHDVCDPSGGKAEILEQLSLLIGRQVSP